MDTLKLGDASGLPDYAIPGLNFYDWGETVQRVMDWVGRLEPKGLRVVMEVDGTYYLFSHIGRSSAAETCLPEAIRESRAGTEFYVMHAFPGESIEGWEDDGLPKVDEFTGGHPYIDFYFFDLDDPDTIDNIPEPATPIPRHKDDVTPHDHLYRFFDIYYKDSEDLPRPQIDVLELEALDWESRATTVEKLLEQLAELEHPGREVMLSVDGGKSCCPIAWIAVADGKYLNLRY